MEFSWGDTGAPMIRAVIGFSSPTTSQKNSSNEGLENLFLHLILKTLGQSLAGRRGRCEFQPCLFCGWGKRTGARSPVRLPATRGESDHE
jgi:hypothetical protein